MLKFKYWASIIVSALIVGATASVQAAPYAAEVMDARTGEIIYSRNANTKLHPASLTKMMTLYIAFSEVKSGRMSLNQRVRFSSNAANEPYGIMGAKNGTAIELRYLIRAAAIRSSNDSATALGEAIAGSEEAFVSYMNQTASRLGMRNTQFQNAHGLTASGHYSTAHDMALLGRRLIYDFPEYYNVFSRSSAETPMGAFPNTNRGFLSNYSGADGIKTGFTNAAGYNLVASARRRDERIIVSMFGGESVAQRNRQVSALMDLGFSKAPSRVAFVPMSTVRLTGPATRTARVAPQETPAAPTQQTAPTRTVVSSPSQQARPTPRTTTSVSSSDMPMRMAAPQRRIRLGTANAGIIPSLSASQPQGTVSGIPIPQSRPANLDPINAAVAQVAQEGRPSSNRSVRAEASGRYAIQLAALNTRSAAERMIISTTLEEVDSLETARNGIVSFNQNGGTAYRPRFSGLSASAARRTCARLQARSQECYIIAPES